MIITLIEVQSTSSTAEGVATALSQFSSLSVTEVASNNGMYVCVVEDNVPYMDISIIVAPSAVSTDQLSSSTTSNVTTMTSKGMAVLLLLL